MKEVVKLEGFMREGKNRNEVRNGRPAEHDFGMEARPYYRDEVVQAVDLVIPCSYYFFF